MDKKSAAGFKKHADIVVKELSLALSLAQGACETDELLRLKASVGDIIARVDSMLYEAVYKDHPDLYEMK
jgi:hypothetical protein